MEMIIRGGKIYDAVHREPYEADILVRDGKIAANGANRCSSYAHDMLPFCESRSLGRFRPFG